MITLAVIPSRGGSTELRRKNLLPVDGIPRFLRSARAARDAGCQVIVSTDDPEIRSTAIVAGFSVHDRGPELADVPVDEVVAAAAEGWGGAVLLVQPTVQPITATILRRFINDTQEERGPTAMVQYTSHQMWRDYWLTEHADRQYMNNPLYQGMGIRWWPTASQVGEVCEWIIAEVGLVDVDTAADYRSITIPKRVAIWPLADGKHGMGHLRRCFAIAERLQHHDIRWITGDMDSASIDILIDRGWSNRAHSLKEGWADLTILDRLSNEHMEHLDGNVVTFEDESLYQADVKIDALYMDGADWCVLRPEFLAGNYQVTDDWHDPKLLIIFGGTDPAGLGERVADLFPNHPVDWIKPGDDKPVAELMHQADILITSAGRTVYEAAAVGIPTVVLAQNLRETTHAHLGYAHGNIYLGLGKLVTDKTIIDTIDTLSCNKNLRQELSERGRPDGLGLDRIVHAIEGLLGGL